MAMRFDRRRGAVLRNLSAIGAWRLFGTGFERCRKDCREKRDGLMIFANFKRAGTLNFPQVISLRAEAGRCNCSRKMSTPLRVVTGDGDLLAPVMCRPTHLRSRAFLCRCGMASESGLKTL
jgi:hypothetical protein